MKIRFRRLAVHRFKMLLGYALAYTVLGMCWQYVGEGFIGFGTVFIGFVLGVSLALFEQSKLSDFAKKMSFRKAILVKSSLYLLVIALPFSIVGLIGGLMKGLNLVDYADWIFSLEFVFQIGIIFVFQVLVVFVWYVNRLLGPKTLIRYISGIYHQPTFESRVFLFLDMKSSTSLAEKLGEIKYFGLLNEFFRDISDPIIEREAEIYQYVGDEVVLTWSAETGLRDANCIRVFTEIVAEIHRKRDFYLQEFGHIPEFKAGLHFGTVITAEIGDIKKDIIYNGDVLNTTSRIESLCNEYGKQLIASQALVEALDLPNYVKPEQLGPVLLRGKSEPIALVALA